MHVRQQKGEALYKISSLGKSLEGAIYLNYFHICGYLAGR